MNPELSKHLKKALVFKDKYLKKALQFRKKYQRVITFLVASYILIVVSQIYSNWGCNWSDHSFTYYLIDPILKNASSFGVEFISAFILYIYLKKLMKRTEGVTSPIVDFTKHVNKQISKITKYKSINILTTFFRFIGNDTSFSENEGLKVFFKEIENSITNKKVKVRILILDPISSAMSQRHKDMKHDTPQRRSILTLYVLNEMREKIKNDEFQVRVFDELPPFLLYKIGNDFSMRFYPKGGLATGNNESYFIFNNESEELSDLFSSKFNETWDNTKCKIEHYMSIFIDNSSDGVKFVDFYDEESGDFFEKKIIAIDEGSMQSKNAVLYRNLEHKFEIPSDDKLKELVQNLNFKITENNLNEKLTLYEINEYVKKLWQQKYQVKPEETPTSFTFIELTKLENDD